MKTKYLLATFGLLISIAPALQAQDAAKGKHAGKGDHEARMLAKFDANKNGVLDPDEQAALDKFKAERKAAALAKYDKNGDGKLDKTERQAMKADHGGKGKKHDHPTTTGTSAAQQ